MFKIHRPDKGEGIKKSIQKILEPKKDVFTRLKHLKLIIDQGQEHEISQVFESHYSHIYYIFHENFLVTEANLRQKGSHRAQRDELFGILSIFEQILIHLPELIRQRWQYQSIDNIIKKLLHTQNSLRVRREGMHLFLLWLRALRENALPHTVLIHACLVPGFPSPTRDGKPYSLEWLVSVPFTEDYGVHPAEVGCLVPRQSGEKFPEDQTKYFLDALLEYMVTKCKLLKWKDPEENVASFSYLWDLFKQHYLIHAFPDFSLETNVYNPVFALPQPRDSVNYLLNVSDTGSIDHRIEVSSGCSMLPARVSIIKWVVFFTSVASEKDSTLNATDKDGGEVDSSHPTRGGRTSSTSSHMVTASNSNTSLHQTSIHDSDPATTPGGGGGPYLEKVPSISSLSSLDDRLRTCATTEGELVRKVFYLTRTNVNYIHELFRQAFMLPLTEAPTIRKVVQVYQEWIQTKETPIFMEESPIDVDDPISPHAEYHKTRNMSYQIGQRCSIMDESDVRAGVQSTYQLFVTNSAHVFLVSPPSNAPKLVEEQVNICKQALNLYRHMVMNVKLSKITWEQLLSIMLHVTQIMLPSMPPPIHQTDSNLYKSPSVSGRLASVMFQTTIVSWIKSNLYVHVSRDLWDEVVDVFASLTNWKELIHEWSKNMDTMTRVLSRTVYKLELQDLPLDRPADKLRKRKFGLRKPIGADELTNNGAPLSPERSFSRGFVGERPHLLNDGGGRLAPISDACHDQLEGNLESLHTRARSATTHAVPNLDELGHRKLTHAFERKPRSFSTNVPSPTPLGDKTPNTAPPGVVSSSQQSSLVGSSLFETDERSPRDSHPSSSSDQSFDIGVKTAQNSSADVSEISYTHRKTPSSGDVMTTSTRKLIDDDDDDDDDDMFDELVHERLQNANPPTPPVMQQRDEDPDHRWPNPSHHHSDVTSNDPRHQRTSALPPAIPARRLPVGTSVVHCSSITSSTSSSCTSSPLTELWPMPTTSQPSFDHLLHRSALPSDVAAVQAISPFTSAGSPSPLSMDYMFDDVDEGGGGTLKAPSHLHIPPPSTAYQGIDDCASTPSSGEDDDLPDESPNHRRHHRGRDSKHPSPSSGAPSSGGGHESDHGTGLSTSSADVISLDRCEVYEKGGELDSSPEEIFSKPCSTPHPAAKHGRLSVVRNDMIPPTSQGSPTTAHCSIASSEDNTTSLVSAEEERSILAGGRKTGWTADVAVVLWRRLLGLLGDVNVIHDGEVHKLVFEYLINLWTQLFRMRMNIGVSFNDRKLIEQPELVPPLRILAPWAFKAIMSLPESHKGGKLCAYQLICKMTVMRDQDLPFDADYLAQFYYVLHEGLHSTDKEVVNEIIGSCSQYFSSDLPSKLLLLLDFIYACHTVAASDNTKAPRLEAQTILGSTLCFPNLYHNVPVLTPQKLEPTVIPCHNMKDYVVDALIFSARKEPSAPARCIALSSIGIWLYEELSSDHVERHPRVKEAINVLLVSLKFSDREIAMSACSMLHLLMNSCDKLLEYMPDTPLRIIDVMALTVSDLLRIPENKKSTDGRQLIVSLFMCILDWCMAVPLRILVEEQGEKSGKRLIRTVFKALQTAAVNNNLPRHRTTHSYTLNDLKTTDFDPDLELNQIRENSSSTLHKLAYATASPSPNKLVGNAEKAISLAAQIVLAHLTNHLGHFPLEHGSGMLSSRVSEHHDIDPITLDSTKQIDDLSPKLFASPNVQFLIYNNSCLMSVIEIPAQQEVDNKQETATEEDKQGEEEEKKGDDVTRKIRMGKRSVRFIIRDGGGKYSWDATLLYGNEQVEQLALPVKCEPATSLDEEIAKTALMVSSSSVDYNEDEMRQPMTAKLKPTLLSTVTDPVLPGGPDKLDRMLQYIGGSSPECLTRVGIPLNLPSSPPKSVTSESQNDVVRRILRHQQKLRERNAENTLQKSWRAQPHRPPAAIDKHEPFYHARLLLSQMGFVSRECRQRVDLLQKSERVLRNLRNIDNAKCRETHKMAVIYIAPGQEDKVSVLSNAAGSKEYEQFVAGLGWEVDLSSHRGFTGKLQKDKLTGNSAPYFATSAIEVIFHVATRFSAHDEEGRHRKLKHIGNDEVHIVWSEHHRDYRRDIIPTDFGDVVIVVYPINHGLYRIDVLKKPEVPSFGPLYSGAIVNGRILPVLVRETAINAGRAKRSHITYYQHFYEERSKYLQTIINDFRDKNTYESFGASLFQPSHNSSTSQPTNHNPRRRAAVITPSTGATHLLVDGSSSQQQSMIGTMQDNISNNNNNSTTVATAALPVVVGLNRNMNEVIPQPHVQPPQYLKLAKDQLLTNQFHPMMTSSVHPPAGGAPPLQQRHSTTHIPPPTIQVTGPHNHHQPSPLLSRQPSVTSEQRARHSVGGGGRSHYKPHQHW